MKGLVVRSMDESHEVNAEARALVSEGSSVIRRRTCVAASSVVHRRGTTRRAPVTRRR